MIIATRSAVQLPFRHSRYVAALLSAILSIAFGRTLRAEEAPTFLRGLNLNGPSVTIDGHVWDGKDSKSYFCSDQAFESQNVSLLPSTDAARATMIRSSRWGGNRIELKDIPDGEYTIFLYVWEDNDPERYSISINDRLVQKDLNSGNQGRWQRLGPWYVQPNKGAIVMTSSGGAANFSGVEVWRGKHDGADAPELTAEQLAFFEKKIRPLLNDRCYECHSEEADPVEGDLLVDSAPTLLRGGASGPAIVPGKPEESLLFKAVTFDDPEMQMPPDNQLNEREIESIREWITLGAPDPRRKATRIASKTIDLAKARQFWSFRPLVEPPVPAVKNSDWPKNDIDRFILARLEAQNLQPVTEADKRTLIRRATFDLTGLPPAPEAIDAFLKDESPVGFEKVIDRLLASQQYGERWGRHWMDLVRYADTAGDNSDYPIPQHFRYRNYIIDSFNKDKPYNQFVREQIAGDLLPAKDDRQRNEQLIATGYIANSRRFGSVIEDYPTHLTIEDTIDNLGRVFMGLTISCARCHDHKFDPILQTDYYGLYGIFESTKYPFPGIELDKKPRDFATLFADGKPSAELVYAVSDSTASDTHLQIRGEPKNAGELVPRKFLELFGGEQLNAESAKQSGRLQLAQWMTSNDNPLLARVMVNRIWQQHFGTGLVSTASDFGIRGQLPTHPELLDWLATRFIAEDWSFKKMHRTIMLSRTWQLSSQIDLENEQISRAEEIDPNSELRWRFSRQRLDAESLRDTLLAISGELDTTMPNKPHPFPPVEKWEFTQHHPFRDSYESNRRSVYLMTARLNSHPFFTTFDGPDRNASTAKRDRSVTTVQSLYMLNDEFVYQRAEQFAQRLLKESPNDEDRVVQSFLRAFGRPPAESESANTLDYISRYQNAERTGTSDDDNAARIQAWSSFCRALFRTNEFLYFD